MMRVAQFNCHITKFSTSFLLSYKFMALKNPELNSVDYKT